MMRVVVIVLLGVHLAYAGTHSLKYFYTGASGDIDFPEFTAVGLVDDGQFMYFDSNIKKAVPKTEWIRQNEGEDYWDRETQVLIGSRQVFKYNIQIAKERFNQSKGAHTVQIMYGCEWDDQTGETDGFRQYGYDGEDFLSLDLKEMRWISPVPQGVPTVHKWNNDRADLEGRKHYLSTVCIEWLKKYLEYGKSSLQKTVSPQVSLLQKDPSSPVTCHATGFYPSGVTITWMKNGQEHHEDVDLGELLPNEDGTFQRTSTIRVTPDEWKKNEFSCVVEHQGKTLTEKKIRANNETSVPIAIIVGAVTAVTAVILLVVIGVAGFMVYRKKKGFKPVKPSDDSSSQRSTNTLISSGSGSSTSS
ncbi:major histocompatibility complex class I-related gene protein isoform X13 [Ctenopharyngodon idella]|uniref:major histocompatibility complex class I-related gene protein isoform X10 n=1 Tax=Ctenopharyngodon idella TaxID=7959 RepID=UPI0022308648|nr:major histocompatibility complex class I-related gene protein isoform X10 [Ctenopharyngodon idella]XP_051729009.1 major histocompatibility complex class I-related gene protein isoform X13 [Ctenopharyngodon idella]